MADMVTVLTEYAMNGDSKSYTTSGHTAQLPRMFIQKRRVPASGKGNASSSTTVLRGVTDANSIPVAGKVAVDINTRYPLEMTNMSAEVDAVIAIVRDFVASDDFPNMFKAQLFAS